MVCYHTPKPTSLDILDLQDHNHTNKNSSQTTTTPTPLRSRMRPLGQATSSSSSSQHAPHDGDENDEGYKSCDDNDDSPLLNEDDDYVDKDGIAYLH